MPSPGSDGFAGNPKAEVVVPSDSASSPVSTSRPSAPTRRTRTRPSSGWNTSIRTKASSAGCGLLPPDPLQRPGRPQGDPAGSARQALPPAELYAKAVFPTLDEQARRQGRPSPASGTLSSAPMSPSNLDIRRCRQRLTPASAGLPPRRGRSPASAWRSLGDSAGRRAVPHLRRSCSCIAADALSRRRRLRRSRGQLHPRQHHRALGTRRSCRSFWMSIRISAASAALGAVVGLAIALAVIRGRLPGRHPLDGDDLFGRRLQFRRHPAGLRLPRHARPARPRHHHPQDAVRLRHLSRRLQPAELLGPDPHLSLLPDPADDPDHRARPSTG